jgi:DMSO/TMAO reductase YedYZ molybdopterin-dependent catalytic subunit
MTSSASEPERERVPPGQRLVTDFPVLHAGKVSHIDQTAWTLTISGLVEPRLVINWQQLKSLPATEQISDIHCVTDWTKLDTTWKGVRVSRLLKGVSILPEAKHCVVHADGGWTTNLPLEELLRDDVLAAYEYDGHPISAEHGGPVRLLVPRLYFWKSAKWLTGIELTADERLGFWETRGYHALGDPWLEQRYS